MDSNIAKASRIGTERLIVSLMSGVRTIDPATAFRTLNKRRIANKHLVMRRLLEAPESDGQVKLEAALALGRSRHRDKVKILLNQLEKGDDLARFGAVRALSLQDKPELFDQIHAFRVKEKTGFVKREAQYAETVLAYRLNLSEGTIKVPASRKILDPGKDTVSISLRRSKLGNERIEEIRKGFDVQAIGIDTSKSPVFSARCGKREVLILLKEGFGQHRSLDWMVDRKSISAVVGFQEFCPQTYSAAIHIFSHPTGKSGHIKLHGLSPRGRIIVVGKGHADGGTLNFSLRSLDVSGQFGLYIEGAIDATKGSLTFEKAVSDLRVQRPGTLKTPRGDS